MKDRIFLHIPTGEKLSAAKTGRELYEEGWKEQKKEGAIPRESADFKRPHLLNTEDYIDIAVHTFQDDEDYEEVTE